VREDHDEVDVGGGAKAAFGGGAEEKEGFKGGLKDSTLLARNSSSTAAMSAGKSRIQSSVITAAMMPSRVTTELSPKTVTRRHVVDTRIELAIFQERREWTCVFGERINSQQAARPESCT
jgi:hypothetical protein